LKLENIMLNEDGYIKLIDFGLSKMMKNSELSQTLCGTPEYLAPEMITQEGHDRMVDWWAVGIMAFELIVGVTPFYN
jgi:serine/threonine protein kinase